MRNSILNYIAIPLVVISIFGFFTITTLTKIHAQGSSKISDGEQLAQVNKITNPDDAEAFHPVFLAWGLGTGAAKTAYDLWCSFQDFQDTGDKCPVDSSSWGLGMAVQNLVYNATFMTICDKTTDDLLNFGAVTGKFQFQCWDPTAKVDWVTVQNSENYVRVGGGLAGLGAISGGTLAAISDPKSAPVPTNLALYFNDVAGNTLFGTSAYAQGASGASTFDGLILQGWKITRNIALSLFGVMLAAAGLMVMMRAKLAPQVTVSIYSVLPMIPVSLGFIFLSYPIVGLFYSFIGPLTELAISLGVSIVANVFFANAITQYTNMSYAAAGSLNAAINLFSHFKIAGAFMLFMVLGMLIAGLVAIFGGIYVFMRIYLTLLYIAIVSPFVGVMSIIPGKSGLILNTIKTVIANVLALPVATLLIFIGLAIIAYLPNPADPSAFGDFFGAAFNAVWGSYVLFFVAFAKLFIGLGIIWQAVKVRGTMEKVLGVHPLFGAEEKRR